MRSILFFCVASFLFSCKSERVAEFVPDFERELIGFGSMGIHPDSMRLFWNYFPEMNINSSFSDYLTAEFSRDTFAVSKAWFAQNYLIYPDYANANDSSLSHWLISQNNGFYKFDRIGFDSILPDSFFVKMYNKKFPDGLQFFDFRGWDVSKDYHFQIDSTGHARLLYKSNRTSLGSVVCLRFSWSEDEQLYLNSFINAFVESRLDTFSFSGTMCFSSTFAQLLYKDSLYYYDAPAVNHMLLYFATDFFVSRQRWYHVQESEGPRVRFTSPVFRGYPNVIEWKADIPSL